MSLDRADAAELAELLQFVSDWLGADQDRLGRRCTSSSAPRATTSLTYGATWPGLAAVAEAAGLAGQGGTDPGRAGGHVGRWVRSWAGRGGG